MDRKRPAFTLVKKHSELSRICAVLEREKAIGVDLEADSMFHYQEKVCLIQISTPLQNILIDPLLTGDLSLLKPLFADTHIRKVFHGADYDIRSLYRDFNIEVNSLFDTQIAARFLGITETGLASLLKKNFGISVEKKYQKRDWSKRPLTEAMLAYAVQDTSHLLSLSRILEKELRTKERLSWVDEECKLLSRVRSIPTDNNPLFLKFKRARRLDPLGLAVLDSILQFRKDIAIQRDRPLFKVLGNAPIMDIAKKKPLTKKDLEQVDGLSARQIKTMGSNILKRIDETMRLSKEQLPVFPPNRGPHISNKSSGKVKALREWREQRAKGLGLDPSLVCTNAQIQTLANAHPKNQKQLKGVNEIKLWQKKVFGKEICAIFKSTP